jgi:hypothetical protein
MKSFLLKIIISVIVLSGAACNSIYGKETKTTPEVSENIKIEVFYFHYTRRCATCIAVEDETKKILKELYADQLESKSIIFKTINLDESESEEITEGFEISGQTLLIVAGDKKENITTDAFMNARTNPEKLKEIIKSTVDPLLDM